MVGSSEYEKFSGLWPGGYLEGDPRNPVGQSTYGGLSSGLGYISVLYAVYQACIKPYVSGKVVLEIGPGRGAWTKTMLSSSEVWCMDVLSAEETCFWDYVGKEHKSKVNYLQVDDFLCSDLPENHFDYMFSWATFCHLTLEQQLEYYKNIFPKLRKGANAFVMFADFEKYNHAIRNIDHWRIRPLNGKYPFVSGLVEALRYLRLAIRGSKIELLNKNKKFLRGSFIHADAKEVGTGLENLGYEIVNLDVGLNLRDPIIHFTKA